MTGGVVNRAMYPRIKRVLRPPIAPASSDASVSVLTSAGLFTATATVHAATVAVLTPAAADSAAASSRDAALSVSTTAGAHTSIGFVTPPVGPRPTLTVVSRVAVRAIQ